MGLAEGYSAVDTAINRREEARRLAAQQNMMLRQQGFDSTGKAIEGGSFEQKEALMEQQLKLQSQQLKKMQGVVYAQDTATAVDMAANTGDWSHVQKLFDESPDLAKVWQNQGVFRVENINFEADGGLLARENFKPEHYDTPEKRKDIMKKAFKIDKTGKGDWTIRTAGDILANTNIAKKMSFSQLDNLNNLFRKQATSQQPYAEDALAKFTTSYKELVPDASEQEVLGMYAKFNSSSKTEPQRVTGDLEKFTDGYKKLFPDASNEQIWEAYGRNKAKEGGDPRTAFQKDTEWLRGTYGNEVADSFVNTRTTWAPTSATKELSKVDEVKGSLEEKYPDFYETDFKQGTKEYREVERDIQKLERYLGIKPSDAERKQMADIKATIALAKSGTQLTEKDTGMIDNLVGNVKKYVSKDAPPEAKAAYSQMMTSIRNALYGATLPAAEMTSYVQAYGSLYQQLPAVQTAMLPALKDLKARFEAIQDTGDEAVSHFRLGVGKKELDNIIGNLDGMIKGTVPSQGSRTITPTQGKTSAPVIKEWQGKKYKQLPNGDWAEVK
jgi:hypothetical protein